MIEIQQDYEVLSFTCMTWIDHYNFLLSLPLLIEDEYTKTSLENQLYQNKFYDV